MTNDNIYILKRLVKNSALPNHNIYTPIELCEEIISNIDKNVFKDGCNIGVLCTVELIPVLVKHFQDLNINKYNITLLTDNGKYKYFIEKSSLKTCCKVVLIDYNDIKKGILCNMKFDVIVGNPPFNENLHLNFLLTAIKIGTENSIISLIQPASWALQQVPGTNKIKKSRQILEKYKSSISFIDAKKSFPQISLGIPLANFKIDKKLKNKEISIKKINGDEYNIKTLSKLNQFHDVKIFPRIKEKIMSTPNLSINIGRNGKYLVILPACIGNITKDGIYKNDFFCFFTLKNLENCITNTIPIKKSNTRNLFIGFDTKNEAKNFKNYLKGYFARFCLSIVKFDRTMAKKTLSTTPWLDFTQEWTDEKCFKLFKITKEEQKFIYDTIPQFYPDVPKPVK